MQLSGSFLKQFLHISGCSYHTGLIELSRWLFSEQLEMCLNNYFKAAGSALRNSTHSDLKLICRSVATIVIITNVIFTNVILTLVIVFIIIMAIVIIIIIVITSDGVVAAHQCLLEPLSPLLSTIFQQHNCCNCRSYN